MDGGHFSQIHPVTLAAAMLGSKLAALKKNSADISTGSSFKIYNCNYCDLQNLQL
jgi:hypothetical protein